MEGKPGLKRTRSLTSAGQFNNEPGVHSSEWGTEEWGCGQRRPLAKLALRRPATRATRRKGQRGAEARRRLEATSSSDEASRKPTTTAAQLSASRARELRPSQIVQAVHYGSDSDAVVRLRDRSAVRNRRRAAILLLESVADTGHPTHVNCQRFFPVDSPYEQSLVPPEAERGVGPVRAPRELLSFTQQGKRSTYPGAVPRKAVRLSRKLEKVPVLRSPRPASPLSAASGYSNRSALEEVCPWDSPSLLPAPGDDPARSRNLSDSDCGAGTASGKQRPSGVHPLVKTLVRNDSDDPLCQPEENLFISLFSKARNQAMSRKKLDTHDNGSQKLFRKTESPTKVKKPTQRGQESGVGRSSRKRRRDSRPATCEPDLSKLDQFSRSVYKGLEYASATKRVRLDDDGRSLTIEPIKTPTAPAGQTIGFGGFEEHTKSFGSRMLRKMGFTGQGLGAKEQGIINPLEGKSLRGRSGLGMKIDRGLDRIVRGGGADVVEMGDANQGLQTAIPRFRSKREGDVELSRPNGGRADEPSEGREPIKHDVFAARRTQRSLLQEDDDLSPPMQVEEDCKVDGEGTGRDKSNEEDEDCFETDRDVGDENFDNGRRGILVEFDALVKGARERRLQALRAAVCGFEGIPESLDMEKLLSSDAQDVSDEQAVRLILSSAGMEATDEICDKLLEAVDAAHAALPRPIGDQALLQALKAESQLLHIGILHRGTRKRLNRELKELNLASTFISTTKAIVDHTDQAPYFRSWKDLMCRLGVTARQTLIVFSDQGMSPLPAPALAARILGARSMVYIDSSDSSFDSRRLSSDSDICKLIDVDFGVCDSSYDGSLPSFRRCLADQSNPIRFRRVLALYETEGLWYAGRAEYCSRLGDLDEQKILVRYYKWNNVEWVDAANTVPLVRSDYNLIRNAKFPGLLFPDDVSGGLLP